MNENNYPKKWTDDEKKQMIIFISKGKNYSEVGKILNRSKNAIRMSYEKIILNGIKKNYTTATIAKKLSVDEKNIIAIANKYTNKKSQIYNKAIDTQTDRNHTERNHTERNHTDRNKTDCNHTDHNHTDRNHTDCNRTESSKTESKQMDSSQPDHRYEKKINYMKQILLYVELKNKLVKLNNKNSTDQSSSQDVNYIEEDILVFIKNIKTNPKYNFENYDEKLVREKIKKLELYINYIELKNKIISI